MDIKQEQQQHQPQLPPAPPQVQQPHSNENFNLGSNAFLNLTDLPKFPVPPGAKSSLVNAGLSSNQIDLLSALVAQHQASLGNTIPLQTPITTTTSTSSVNTPLSVSPSELPLRSSNSQLQLHTQLSTSSNNTLLDPILSSSSTSPPSGSAAELDKKRRNTAASARFRFKKKLKEKQMETKIQNLEELIVGLESQLNNLEMENKLLRNLIIEKGSQKSEDEVKLLKEKARME
ncbi:zip1 Transcription factor zip1 [Candida maltosa Xu316]